MCEAGRIRHHLKHNLWREDSTILFVGYQSEGTVGRKLTDGETTVRLFNEDITVRAKICSLAGISGHADQGILMRWLGAMDKAPKMVFVNHGDPDAVEDYAACLRDEYGYDVLAPYSGTSFDLLSCEVVELTKGIPIARKAAPRDARAMSAFDNLLTAAYGLVEVCKTLKGIPNKELAKFAGEIRSLAAKWQNYKNK